MDRGLLKSAEYAETFGHRKGESGLLVQVDNYFVSLHVKNESAQKAVNEAKSNDALAILLSQAS